jgi:zinc transporter 1/2/3
MFSVFCIFIVELIAFRWGTGRLAKLGIHYGSSPGYELIHTLTHLSLIFPDAHGHGHGSHAAHGPEGFHPGPEQQEPKPEASELEPSASQEDMEDLEKQKALLDNNAAQIIGVAILEFGVLLHRYCYKSFDISSCG